MRIFTHKYRSISTELKGDVERYLDINEELFLNLTVSVIKKIYENIGL